MITTQPLSHLPDVPFARFQRPRFLSLFFLLMAAWLIGHSFVEAEISPVAFIEGLPEMWSVLQEMFPPNFERLPQISILLLHTLYMAIAGTVIGVILSFPVSVLAAEKTSPHPLVSHVARAIISLARTIPDLVWALFFVVTVGIGAFAGVLTIAIDTLGFCSRFFAEAIEETDKNPEEALQAIGASRLAILATYIFPTCTPSFINTCLFSLEKAVRSSVVLGLVGAGGIGIELRVAMDTFRYDEAITVILLIFALVVIVEQISTRARKSLLADH
ncbi:MAG: phosphonate ABC transporter, permease protein PhnE [Bdellovibrionales bacterium]|nr:phosphonate ABC transporter, permease protein PhnE [Bdellovibrionales bacterium]